MDLQYPQAQNGAQNYLPPPFHVEFLDDGNRQKGEEQIDRGKVTYV